MLPSQPAVLAIGVRTPPESAIDSIRNQQAKPEQRCHPLEHGEQRIGTGIAGRFDAPATKAAGFPWAKTALEPDQAGGYGGQLAVPVAAVGIDLGTSDDAEFRQHRVRANAHFKLDYNRTGETESACPGTRCPTLEESMIPPTFDAACRDSSRKG